MTSFKSKFLSDFIPFLYNAQKRSIGLFSRRQKKETPYVIVRANAKEHCYIVDQLWQYYYPEEPTTVALGLGHRYNPVFDEEASKYLAEGLSLVAKCKYSGDIVGACINKTVCPWDPDMTDQLACSLSCPRTRQLFHFYAYILRAPCLWQRYGTNKIFEMCQLYVRRNDRGKGLGFLLMEASKKLGTDCGYRVIKTDATNFYTCKICEKLKMQLAFEIPYCAYTGRGPTREPVFKPPPPHDACRIYVHTPFVVC